MSHTITVNSGDQIMLPDGNLYDAGDTAVLTDAQFARITSTMFAGGSPILTDAGQVDDDASIDTTTFDAKYLALTGGTLTGPVIGFQDKGSQIFNVKAYGAKGDGATNDVAAVTAAHTAATMFGGIVYFPQGRYSLPTSTQIVLDPRLVTWMGAGPSTTLDFSSSTYAGYVLSVTSTGQHEVRNPLANFNFVGPTSPSTTVKGVKLGGGTSYAPHCTFYNVRWYGFAIQVQQSSNSWACKWFSCHWEAAQVSAWDADTSGTGFGELNSFYGCAFYNNPQECVTIGPSGGLELAFFGTSFDYSGRFFNIAGNKVTCYGCHFEGHNAFIATGSNEMILVHRDGSSSLPVLQLNDCSFYPLWTARQATITVTGTTGGSTVVVNNANVTTGSIYGPATFIQQTSTTPSLDVIEVNNISYTDITAHQTYWPLRLVTATATTPLWPGLPHSAVQPSFPQGIGGAMSSIALAAIGSPDVPIVTQVGAAGATSYWYKWVANLKQATGNADTSPSAATLTTTGNATLNGTNYNVVTGLFVQGATSYKLLKSTDGATYALLASGLLVPSFNDQGQATSAFTVTPYANPMAMVTTSGLQLKPAGISSPATPWVASPGLWTDNGFRVFLTGNGAAITLMPQGGGSSLGRVDFGVNVAQFSGGIAHAIYAQTLGANGAVAMNAFLGDIQANTLGANATSSSVSNATLGQIITIEWTQDGTGGRTYVWPPNCRFAGSGATPPAVTAANQTDSVTFRFDGANWIEIARAIDMAAQATSIATKAPIASPTFTTKATTPELDISGTAGAGFLALASQSADPAAPAAGTLDLYARTVAGREQLGTVNSAGAVRNLSQRLGYGRTWIRATPQSSTVVRSNGTGTVVATNGTVSTPAATAATGLMTNLASTAGAGQTAYAGCSTPTLFFRGAGADVYAGFGFYSRVRLPDASYNNTGAATGSRIWGLAAAVLQTTTLFSTARGGVQDLVGFEREHVNGGNTDTNWQFVTCDNTTTNAIDTTMPFTIGHVYDMWIWCPAGSTTIYWQVDDVTAATTKSGSTSTNLPRATSALIPIVGLQTVDAVIRNIQFADFYAECDKG